MNPLHLMVGSRDPDVRVLQEKLLLKPDGVFGPKTERAVIELAKKHNASA